MNKQLIEKMIRNCFYQYQHTLETVPLTQQDYDTLYKKVIKTYTDDQDLHDIVQDVVYEFLTTDIEEDDYKK
ncbi:YqzH family protein [Bacillus salitolerans]|uniref:YqzH family protein n=1 Tax=Bacillus salitolerans TaxID=1437434 RepID=A0ABW4LUC0_9BACI